MSTNVIEDDPRVQELRARIRTSCKGKFFSDLVQPTPGGELQYVDLVMEGGGVLGLALVGYVHALETAGIRFLSVGGTSAGSILALLLMACDDRDKPKSPQLLDIVFNMDMKSFVDGDSDARDMSMLIAEGDLAHKQLKLAWYGAQVIDNIRDDLGLNPGTAFLSWLDGHLGRFGTPTMAALKKRIAYLPKGLRRRGSARPLRRMINELGIVAADITTETKAVFPKMAPLYWADPNAVSPAQFVRASMSIPVFFLPHRVNGIRSIPNVEKLWSKVASFDGRVPDEVLFADGGTMSNFPIGLFHEDGVPTAPTFGIKLGGRSREVHDTRTIFDYGVDMFNAIRHYADFEFIANNPDYRRLIGYIDTSGHNWLNFFMNDSEKADLFVQGMRAGAEFLEAFDWRKYKRTRKRLAKVKREEEKERR